MFTALSAASVFSYSISAWSFKRKGKKKGTSEHQSAQTEKRKKIVKYGSSYLVTDDKITFRPRRIGLLWLAYSNCFDTENKQIHSISLQLYAI